MPKIGALSSLLKKEDGACHGHPGHDDPKPGFSSGPSNRNCPGTSEQPGTLGSVPLFAWQVDLANNLVQDREAQHRPKPNSRVVAFRKAQGVGVGGQLWICGAWLKPLWYLYYLLGSFPYGCGCVWQKKSRAFGFKVEHWTAGHTDKYVYAIFKGTLESKVAPSCRYFYRSVFVSSAIPSSIYLLELCCGALSTSKNGPHQQDWIWACVL